MRALKAVAVAGCGILLGLRLAVPARAEETYSPNAVIAAYLYRFTSYIDWPQQPVDRRPFVIDVYGDTQVAQALRRLLPGHPIRNEVAQVREINSARDVDDAQMLFVGAGHADFLRTLAADDSLHLLIVTNEAQGLEQGAVLNFVTVDNRVRFEVSLTAAERAGVKISSELLSVAIRVHGGRRQSGEPCIRFAAPEDGDAVCSTSEALLLPEFRAAGQWLE